MQDQLALLPTQLALRCISQGLRGGLPVVLGLSALTIGGTIYGAAKGVKSLQKYCEKPKSGENKGWKIRKDIDSKKNGIVYAFEMKKEVYIQFAKEAKDLGVAYAATDANGIVHLITDNKNRQIVDMLRNTANNLKTELKASENAEENTHNADQNEIRSADKANKAHGSTDAETFSVTDDELEENLFREVPFENSIWNEIIKYIQERFISPLKGTTGIDIEENNTQTIISYDTKDRDKVTNRVDNLVREFESALDPEQLAAFSKFTEDLDYRNSLNPKKAEKLEVPIRPKVTSTPALDILANNFSNFTASTQKVADGLQEQSAENTVYLNINQYPEIKEMIVALMPNYVDKSNDITAILDEMSKGLKEIGIKGSIALDKENNISISFSANDKNNIIRYAKDVVARVNEGKSKGLDPVKAAEEALEVMSDSKAVDDSQLNNFASPELDAETLAANEVAMTHEDEKKELVNPLSIGG